MNPNSQTSALPQRTTSPTISSTNKQQLTTRFVQQVGSRPNPNRTINTEATIQDSKFLEGESYEDRTTLPNIQQSRKGAYLASIGTSLVSSRMGDKTMFWQRPTKKALEEFFNGFEAAKIKKTCSELQLLRKEFLHFAQKKSKIDYKEQFENDEMGHDQQASVQKLVKIGANQEPNSSFSSLIHQGQKQTPLSYQPDNDTNFQGDLSFNKQYTHMNDREHSLRESEAPNQNYEIETNNITFEPITKVRNDDSNEEHKSKIQDNILSPNNLRAYSPHDGKTLKANWFNISNLGQFKTIFGKDTRVPYPYMSTPESRAIARTCGSVRPSGIYMIGTAFLIYGGLILTAGHNNRDFQNDAKTIGYDLSWIEFNVPYSDSEGKLNRPLGTDMFRVYRNTKDNGELIPDDDNPYNPPVGGTGQDWCIAKLDKSHEALDKYGFFRLTDEYVYSGPLRDTDPVALAGYGQMINERKRFDSRNSTLQIAYGEIKDENAVSKLLSHHLPMDHGSSGSPMFKKKNNLVVGMAVAGNEMENLAVGMKNSDLTRAIMEKLKVDWIVDDKHPDTNESGTVTNPFKSFKKAFNAITKDPKKCRIGFVSGSLVFPKKKPSVYSIVTLGPGPSTITQNQEL